MTWPRLAPLLLLPVALSAWAQGDTGTPGAGVVGISIGATAMGILAALLRRQEMGALLLAFADVVRGGGRKPPEGCVETEVHKRVRHALGVQLDPTEPPPGTGLLVDVAKIKAQQAHHDAQIEALVSSTKALNTSLERLTAAIEAQSDARQEAVGRRGSSDVG